MKKLTFCVLAASFVLSVIPTQLKAATEAETDRTAIISTETVSGTDQLTEIKAIEVSTLNSTEKKEALKEVSPLVNEQGRHNGRFNNRRNRDVDVTIQSDEGYRHHHGGAYIGGGGALLLILILILVL